jgi:Concanavalin A-like lectin/glucanases superfamily
MRQRGVGSAQAANVRLRLWAVAGVVLACACAVSGGVASAALADDPAYVQAVQADHPAAYYQLDEAAGATQAADSAGTSPMTPYNGVTFGADGPPGVGTTAATLDGTSQYLATAAPVLSSASTWTLEGWFAPSDSSQAGFVGYDGNNAGGFGFGEFSRSPWGGRGGCLSGFYGGITWFLPTDAECFTQGRWFYVVLERDAGGDVSFYIDDELASVGYWSGGIHAPGSPQGATEIGAEYDESNAPQAFFAGSIGQVAFYDHALSSARIRAHYDATLTAPQNVTAPLITGTPQDGETLTADDGGWSGSTPTSYAYQWQACGLTGSSCHDIPGATDSSYTLSGSDAGQTVRVQVTAANDVGSAAAASDPTAVIAGAPPSNSDRPTISGVLEAGAQVTASEGSWSGTAPLSYTYQWQLCDDSGDCHDIAGATDPTYTIGDGDMGQALAVVVTASNAAGSDQATSDETDLIGAPANTTPPEISGTTQDGNTLTASDGTWDGEGPFSYTYQWEWCDEAGDNCWPIDGATDSTYALNWWDAGSTMRVEVTAAGPAGHATAVSDPSELVKALPVSGITPPVISGTAQDTRILTQDYGDWSGSPSMVFSFQWERCDDAGSNCQDIDGATDDTYDVGPDDVGSTLVVTVTASDFGVPPASMTSAPTGVVAPVPPPTNVLAPVISGRSQAGLTLRTTDGNWTSITPITYAYQWESCDALGTTCSSIPGATEPTYTPTDDDVGQRIRAVVTAANRGAGSSTASNLSAVVAAGAPATVTFTYSYDADGRLSSVSGGSGQ